MLPRLLVAAALSAALSPRASAQATVPPEYVQPAKGHCIACHQLPEGVGPATRADLGPKLEGARMRALGRERIRQAIEDPTRANPETVMPPFAKHRILSAEEIGRLVDFLHALP
jgi:sulfur-oxidizing protein SoxX